jgi:hypothetical protein
VIEKPDSNPPYSFNYLTEEFLWRYCNLVALRSEGELRFGYLIDPESASLIQRLELVNVNNVKQACVLGQVRAFNLASNFLPMNK